MTAVDTVGVDLAADHRGTAICRITWDGRGAVVHRPERPGRDERILELARDAAKVGIDCPFGWPAAFVGAMSAHAARHPWPDRGRLSGRDHLKFRETDRHVRAACAADAARGLGALHRSRSPATASAWSRCGVPACSTAWATRLTAPG